MNTVLPSAYLPPLSYFSCLNQPNTWIETQEHYIKQTLRTRCFIDSPNGSLRLSVPVQKADKHGVPFNQIRISYDTDWQHQHLRAIQSSYGRSPFFIHYIDRLSSILLQKQTYLHERNLALIDAICKWIKLTPCYKETTEYLHVYQQDMREDFILPDSPPYPQMFDTKFGFRNNLSIIDALFNMGPQTYDLIQQISSK